MDKATYPFEPYDGLGANDGFSISAITDNIGFTSETISADVAYAGYSSLKLDCNFYSGPTPDSNHGGGVIAITAPGMILSHKTITAYVWAPANMFNSSQPDGGSFFIQVSGSYHWYQGPGTNGWENLSTPSGSTPGIWNKISAPVDEMLCSSTSDPASNGKTFAQNGESPDNYFVWGIKIGLGLCTATSPPNCTEPGPFKGTIYIDSVSIQ